MHSVTTRILVSRAFRSAAYGALAVVLAQALVVRGYSPLAIGSLITLALLAGALASALTGRLVRTFGTRVTMAGSGVAMIVAAALLAGNEPAVAIACLLGVVSPGAQDVGPFAAIEQLALSTDGAGVTRRLSWYNVTGAAAIGLGALAAAVVPFAGVLVLYGTAGAVAFAIAWALPEVPARIEPAAEARPKRLGTVERLAALFAVDAFAGGFVIQAFIAYWLSLRFGVGPETIGPLLFAANILAALSYLVADRIAARIGLLNTMVFTHLPSNVLLMLVPFMPTFPLAAAVLLARFALSQMDVPTRQAYTLSLVPAHDRARAAGVTAAVRPAAASLAPVLTGIAFQFAALGVPFVLAGALKIGYDLALLATFRGAPADSADTVRPVPG
ncbi:MAG: major facilitator superfamily 1 [Candidatus Eremiobacteraeota bacterium]|nr:major facilitator superfamily 1 [Candidatus Eremiobacteraeota bacterium]